MAQGSPPKQIVKFYCFFLLLTLAFLQHARANPTHELLKEYQAEVGTEKLVFPAGTRVEVLTESDSKAIAKFTSDKGSIHVIQLPTDLLQKIKSGSPAATVPPAPVTPEKVNEASPPIPAPGPATPPAGDTSPPTEPALVPGQSITLTFPELGPSYQSNPAQLKIRIPENYQPDQASPLALFLGGGEGTESYDSLKSLVDAKSYVLVVFPYSKNVPTPRTAIKENRAKDLIAFQRPMLERLKKLLPHTDPKRRVVIGMSNGAHMIGTASCDGWKEFTDFFSAFVMDEGGSSEDRDFKALRKKDVLFVMGEKSPYRDFNLAMVKLLDQAKVRATVFEAPGEAHEMGPASRQAIKDWVEKLGTN